MTGWDGVPAEIASGTVGCAGTTTGPRVSAVAAAAEGLDGRRITATGSLGAVMIISGIAREPTSMAVHAVRRIPGLFTRSSHNNSAPARIRMEERTTHSPRN